MAAVSTVLLVVGYLLAAPFSLWPPGFRRLWRRRETWVVATELGGTALLVAGWAVRGRTTAVVVNAVWGVGLAVAYVLAGRRGRRTPSPTD